MKKSETHAVCWSYVRACLAFGNGNVDKGRDMIFLLAERLEIARIKHSWPEEAYGKYQALGVIGEEYKELEHAVVHENNVRQRDESLDVAVTAIRFANGEHIVPEETPLEAKALLPVGALQCP